MKEVGIISNHLCEIHGTSKFPHEFILVEQTYSF